MAKQSPGPTIHLKLKLPLLPLLLPHLLRRHERPYMGRDDNDYLQVYGQFIGPYGALLGSTIQITKRADRAVRLVYPKTLLFRLAGLCRGLELNTIHYSANSFDAWYRIS